MKYSIIPSSTILKQIKKLDKQTKQLIQNKIKLIKQNPYRFKKIHSKVYSKVFRVRLNLNNQETRLIYLIIEPNILLVCLLARKTEYKNLEKYLKKMK